MTIDVSLSYRSAGAFAGATAIAEEVEKGGGDLHGGFMLGNIVSSPDASAGTLLAACGVYCAGLPGGLFAALLVYIGNRICYDPGYAGTTGAITATFLVYGTDHRVCRFGLYRRHGDCDPDHTGHLPCPFQPVDCPVLEDPEPVAGGSMIAIYICAAIAVYAALRVIAERNTMRKLPFVNVISFAVTAIIALLLPHPLTILAAAAFFVGSTLSQTRSRVPGPGG